MGPGRTSNVEHIADDWGVGTIIQDSDGRSQVKNGPGCFPC